MRFLFLLFGFFACATPDGETDFPSHPLRKAVVFEGGVYGIQGERDRTMLRGPGDLSVKLGRFHDTFRLQLARSSSRLWIAYGPQVYGWDGQRLQPSLVTKLVGTQDAIEWLGVCDDQAFFVKRTKRGDFSLYAIDSKGIAQFKKKFPYVEGRNQFVLCGHRMMHTSERNSDSKLVSLKSFKEKTLHLIHHKAPQRGGVYGVMDEGLWYGQLVSPHARVLACMDIRKEKAPPEWTSSLSAPLACAPVKRGENLFFITRESLRDSFTLSWLNLATKALGSVEYVCNPLSRDMSLDGVHPLDEPHRYAFIISYSYQGERFAALFSVDFAGKEELFYRSLDHSTTRFVVDKGRAYLTH